MKIKITYVLPMDELTKFPHLKSNQLELELETKLLEEESDIDSCISDLILTGYGICVEKIHYEFIEGWEAIQRNILCCIYERKLNEAYERVEHFEEMRDRLNSDMTKLISEAYQKVDRLKEKVLSYY